jgi:hypothetical protein
VGAGHVRAGPGAGDALSRCVALATERAILRRMRKALAALLLAAALIGLSTPALAAVCGPVPALPDTTRRTEYAGIVAQTGPFNVGFQLYGDGTDYGAWLSVWVNGVAKVAVTDYTVTSPSGALGTLCLPITDAQVTFTAPQTGTIEIEGARRPRRASQFTAQPTLYAFNEAFSDLTAQLRERWDREGRLLRTPPGETLAVLPPAATRAGTFLSFDGGGNPSLASPSPGLGNVVGPNTSIVGHTASWANTTGTLLADGGATVSLANNNIWTGTNTFNPVSGDAITINPAANSYAKGINILQTGPTSGTTAGPLCYDCIDITHSSAVTGSGLDGFGLANAGTVGFRVNFTATGANLGAQGQIGMVVASRFTSAANAGGDKVSFAPTMYTNINASNSILYAINPYTSVGASGSASAIIGADVETNMAVGATVLTRFGLNVVNSGGAQASTLDTAIAITNNSAGGAGGAFKKLLTLSNRFGSVPLDTAADFFFSDTTSTVANIFNLPNVTVTGSIAIFPNLAIGGSGRASFGSGTVPSAPTILQATVASGGQSTLSAATNTTTGFDGFQAADASGNNQLALITNEAARTSTVFGQTSGNWAQIASAGSTNLGLLFGTATAVPIIVGTNNTERFRISGTAGVATLTNNGIGTTSSDGIVLQNTTAAAAGAQQFSPRLHLIGQGWKTTATAASQTTDWIIENQPIQGTTTPTTALVFSAQINGGGYVTIGSMGSSGVLNLATGIQLASLAPSAQVIRGNGTNGIWSLLAPSDLSPNALAKTKVQKFTASGTYTPSTGLINAIIECVGGGGAGGGAKGTTANYYGAGGGGSGSYSRLYATAATIGGSQTVTIGAGGTAGTAGENNGNNGGDTSVGTLCIGKGGSGGLFGSVNQVGAGGAGGVAGTGDATPTGTPGIAGLYATITTVAFPSGSGASSVLGGGAPGIQTGSGTCGAGTSAVANGGGGGSGAICNSANALTAAGGIGGSGFVIITEFTNQ